MSLPMEEAVSDEELAKKLGTLDVAVEGYRRPVLIETVIATGLQTLRPGAKNARSVLIRLIAEVKRLTAKADRADVLSLRVRELERKLAEAQAVFTEADLSQIRTYHHYGMTVRDLAETYSVDENKIRRALNKQERPLPRGTTRFSPKSRKRSLEI